MKLKHLGWQSFLALLLADVVAVVMQMLGIGLKTTITVAALVFVILFIVMAFGLHTKLRGRQRVEAAVAKIAELESQVAESRNEPAK